MVSEQGRPLFGFPENFKDYEAKHFLRLLIIILAYIAIRPLFVYVGNKVQEAQQKKQDEQKKREIVSQIYEEVEVGSSSGTGKKQVIRRKKNTSEIIDEMDSDPDVSDLLQ